MPPATDREATLIHISDVHVFSARSLRPHFLLDKRLLGGLNALLRRRRIHEFDVTLAALDVVRRTRPDHLLVTGDITTLGAEEELRRFRRALEDLPLSVEQITVLPGNHDAYVPSVVRGRLFERVFAPYLGTDANFRAFEWPLVRLRGPLALVGCCTARPCPLPFAVGPRGAQQLARLEAVLADPRLESRCRVVGLHHPPQPGVGHWHNRLTDAAAFRKILARQGAELVLHGHLHQRLAAKLPGPRDPVAVRGVGSVSVSTGPPHRLGQLLKFRVRGREVVQEESWIYHPDRREFLPGN
jgi:3',5'-cyclic AMP phosphodiesterase CpdA